MRLDPRKLVALMLTGSALMGVSAAAHAAEEPGELAVAFGRLPELWGARLSPDGSRISFLHMLEEQDMATGYVVTMDGSNKPFLTSKKDRFELRWCNWANDERLLCGFTGIDTDGRTRWVTTRLVAVDPDGENAKVMLQNRLIRQRTRAQFQDEIVDWMPDDHDHVLVEMPENNGTGVAKLNIYDGSVGLVIRPRAGIREWLTDGHGEPRVRMYLSPKTLRWDYRPANERKWQLLHERPIEDRHDTFLPIGFGATRQELLVLQPYNNRLSLFARDLPSGNERLVFAHDEVDLGGYYRLGKYRRLVAIRYVTDASRYHFFDEDIERVIARVRPTFPGQAISVVDESWDRGVYLLHVSGDMNPGGYYLFDINNSKLKGLWPKYPQLTERSLSPMRPYAFQASDGTRVPGYLTLPADHADHAPPLVVLPHGGPESRDEWGFDWLVQYFAALDYAVLQVNFRGSGGYGDAWVGEGGFRAWRQAIGDITDGVQSLIDEEMIDPSRLCVVGWSYGGYAALMSAIEERELYRCVVSIAGVTDPGELIQDARYFVNRKLVREMIGDDEEVLRHGSPLKRAGEISVPVLLFHGDEDVNVDVQHSKKLHKALRKAGKKTTLVIYDDAEHGIWRNEYRVDMLDRIGEFLATHLQSVESRAAVH
ncbi:MAG: alpha/beta fold hydrolase [Gammaproteobacteria bacterium]|nr:alpha/beta fold hydrolase [Gammaproteobacteria bacterium]